MDYDKILLLHCTISAMAILNVIILDKTLKRHFRRIHKRGTVETIARRLYGLAICSLPVINIIVAFYSTNAYLKAAEESSDFERVKVSNE